MTYRITYLLNGRKRQSDVKNCTDECNAQIKFSIYAAKKYQCSEIQILTIEGRADDNFADFLKNQWGFK